MQPFHPLRLVAGVSVHRLPLGVVALTSLSYVPTSLDDVPALPPLQTRLDSVHQYQIYIGHDIPKVFAGRHVLIGVGDRSILYFCLQCMYILGAHTCSSSSRRLELCGDYDLNLTGVWLTHSCFCVFCCIANIL